MKKLVLLLIPFVLLSSCTIDWNGEKDKKITELEKQITEQKANNVEKKALCFSKTEEYKRNMQFRETFRKTFYSTVLDTCIVELDESSFMQPTSKEGNYTAKSFKDILSWEALWKISYWDNFWFEDPWYLPRECNKTFVTKEGDKVINISFAWTEWGKTELMNKIYSAEYQYENCLSYIKWEPSVSIGIFISPDLDYKPTFVNPPINY